MTPTEITAASLALAQRLGHARAPEWEVLERGIVINFTRHISEAQLGDHANQVFPDRGFMHHTHLGKRKRSRLRIFDLPITAENP